MDDSLSSVYPVACRNDAPIVLDESTHSLRGRLASATVAALALYMPETRVRSLGSIHEAYLVHSAS